MSLLMVERARQWARVIKRDVAALWLSVRDARVPWYAKFVAGAVAAYALSPLDLIPDFIPVLGYLDDLVIVPLGVLVAVKLVPAELMVELREEAARRSRPVSFAGLILVIAIWALAATWLIWLAWPYRPHWMWW